MLAMLDAIEAHGDPARPGRATAAPALHESRRSRTRARGHCRVLDGLPVSAPWGCTDWAEDRSMNGADVVNFILASGRARLPWRDARDVVLGSVAEIQRLRRLSPSLLVESMRGGPANSPPSRVSFLPSTKTLPSSERLNRCWRLTTRRSKSLWSTTDLTTARSPPCSPSDSPWHPSGTKRHAT